ALGSRARQTAGAAGDRGGEARTDRRGGAGRRQWLCCQAIHRADPEGKDRQDSRHESGRKMNQPDGLSPARHQAAMRLLNQAFAAGDDTGFEHALQELNAIRRPDLATGMQRVSQLLLGALTRFRSESRIATLATKDVPGARLRLDHVLHITADAANRTIDIIERLGPLTEATARDAAQLAGSLDPSHAGVVGFLAG